MSQARTIPIKSFSTPSKWRQWLAMNHAKSTGVWLRMFRKNSGEKTISHDEALDEALCYGWIDGQADKYDEKSWIQKFTPRRSKSVWSKRNRERVEMLIKEKRMKPAGFHQVAAAKKDGRWDQAYDSPKNMAIPNDFLQELKKDKRAYAFLLTLNKANTYAIAWRLQTAKKPETRERRMKVLLEMLRLGKRLH
jgi:uncharacterized protein YdeI (YjbR/CyaY-like superfamily)